MLVRIPGAYAASRLFPQTLLPMRLANGLFSIGQMAKWFHLSQSSIRYYEKSGLLTPEYIDSDTGYRYYSTRQFEVFNTIRYLRALDMPLPQIADFLQNRDVGRTI